MKRWYNLSWNKVVDILESNVSRGLSYKQIEINKRKYGKNQIEIVFGNLIPKTILNLIKSPWLIFGILTLILCFFCRSFVQALITIFILIINIILKYVSLAKRKKQISALESLNYTNVRVIRGGIRDFVKAEELVVGDMVYIKPEMIIPADIRLIESENLRVNERNVTGDDFIVSKYETMIEGRISSLGEIKNMVFRGTRVESGEGLGIVTNTGANTELGKILRYLNSSELRKHKLQDKIEKIINEITVYIGTSILALGIILLIITKESKTLNLIADSMFLLSSLGISFVIFISSKLITKISKNNGIDIINLSTIAAIKDINVFFLEKIGSVTAEEMVVKTIYTNGNVCDSELVDIQDVNIKRILNIGLLCNNAIFKPLEQSYKGELSECALLKYGKLKGITKNEVIGKYIRIFEIPYDSNRRIVTTVNKIEKKYRANVRGAVDEVLDRCKYIMKDGIEHDLINEDREKIRMMDFMLSDKGSITQGFAYRSFGYEPTEDENIESNLVFVGIVGFENPVIDGVLDYIRELKANKIVPILIVDDNKIVANHLGRRLGLTNGIDEVISGVELMALNEDEIIDVLSKTRVFSRITPDIKSKILTIFLNDGYNICSTGENLSDMPSIVLSNIGIAKGERPTNLLKKLSDVYIKENYLGKFIELLKISESILENLEIAKVMTKKILLTEIISISGIYLINGDAGFNLFTLAIMNTVLIPLMLLANTFNNEEVIVPTKVMMISESLIESIILISSTYFLNDAVDSSIVTFGMFYFMVILSVSSKIKKLGISSNRYYKVFLIMALVLYIAILSTMIFINPIVNIKKAVLLIVPIILYIIAELIIKKGE